MEVEDQNKPSVDLTKLPTLLSNPSPAFRIWVAEALRGDRLETVIAAVIRAGQAKDETEALLYLNKTVEGFSVQEERFLTSYDLYQPNKQRNVFKKLENSVKGNEKKNIHDFLWRLHGIAGHKAIPELLSGNLLKKRAVTKQLPENDPQLSLFPRVSDEQLTLFDEPKENQGFSISEEPESQYNGENVSRAVKQAWRTLVPIIKKEAGPTLVLWYSHKTDIQKLYRLMGQIFGDYWRQIQKGNEGIEDAYLKVLTAMSWATALIYCKKGRKRILFTEVPVLAKQYGFSGGRIDALEVRSINGKPPTRAQRNILEQLTKQRFSSVGNLLFTLRRAFNTDRIETIIIDWKFAVGDGTFHIKPNAEGKPGLVWEIINPDDVKDSPLQKHLWQMSRYLTLATLDFHLLAKERDITSHWPEDIYFAKGETVYFLPTILPVTHEITVTSQDLEMFLTNEVAVKWNVATRRAAIRHCNKRIVDNLVPLLDKTQNTNGNNHSQTKSRAKGLQKNLLPLEDERNRSSQHAKEMIEKRRVFADEDHIIEVVKQGETPRYELYLDRLLAKIREGKVTTGYFSLPRGGFIRCIMPDHKDERTPSFHISPEQGIFKCFGCGVGGVLAPSSIPSDLNIPIHSPQWARQAYGKTITLAVQTEKHVKIMLLAQELLQRSFRESPGESYLKNVRKLNPDLALKMGVGFGTETLIKGLLDAFTYDDLVFYGFVGISSTMTPERGIGPILKKRIISESEMRREVGRKSKTGEILYGYPHSVLEDRVTFPLVLEGQINNFYGRSIKPNADRAFFHRKLSVANTGIPQGGFNMRSLKSDAPEIIVVEGVMDALTLMEMGYPDTVAIIGTDNTIVIEEIARSGKIIDIALDYDKGGKKETEKLMERLQKRGNSNLQNFTDSFVASHPEMIDGMDWNKWWQDFGKNQINK